MSDTSLLRTLLVSFSLPLRGKEISRWRGAFIELSGRREDLLHNHNGEGYHYRYPLVQYRVRNGKAAVLAYNEGITAVQQTLSQNAWQLRWEGEPIDLDMDSLEVKEYELNMLERPRTYKLYRWVGLNSEKYEAWNQTSSLKKRLDLLEQAIAGHILYFAESINRRLPQRLEVEITDIKKQGWVNVHGNLLMAFDLVYESNIFLPPLLGLGKAVSHGFGWQVPARVPRDRALPQSRRIGVQSTD